MHTEPLEEVVQMSDGSRIFGIVTLPEKPDTSRPVFVFFNSGLLHRVGPVRMSVLLSRKLAEQGFISVRVDLSGKGDTPAQESVEYVDSVFSDYEEVYAHLCARFGEVKTVLAGLCSGADNAVRLAARFDHVVGMLLLDPYCFPDKNYKAWSLVDRYLDYHMYVGKLRAMLRATGRASNSSNGPSKSQAQEVNALDLRELPSREETATAVREVDQRGGSTLAIFTSYATLYYKHVGQLATTTSEAAFDRGSRELRWRNVNHTYKHLPQLNILIDTTIDWSMDSFAQRVSQQ